MQLSALKAGEQLCIDPHAPISQMLDAALKSGLCQRLILPCNAYFFVATMGGTARLALANPAGKR